MCMTLRFIAASLAKPNSVRSEAKSVLPFTVF